MTLDEKAIEAAIDEWNTVRAGRYGADDTSALRAAIAAYERAMWRPISEAPVDGDFLLWGKVDNTVDGPNYEKPEYWSDVGYYIQAYAYENKLAPHGVSRVVTERDGWGDDLLLCIATHFRPLPKPPEE